MKKPLFSTCAVVLLFTALISIKLSDPSLGFFGSIWALVVVIFQLTFFLIGLTVGSAICLTCFLTIYWGINYLYSPQKGKESYFAILAKVKLLIETLLHRFFSNNCAKTENKLELCNNNEHPLKQNFFLNDESNYDAHNKDKSNGISEFIKKQEDSATFIKELDSKVVALDDNIKHFATNNQLEELAKNIENSFESLLIQANESNIAVGQQISELHEKLRILKKTSDDQNISLAALVPLIQKLETFNSKLEEVSGAHDKLRNDLEDLQLQASSPSKTTGRTKRKAGTK